MCLINIWWAPTTWQVWWLYHPSVPKTILVLRLKILHPGDPLSPLARCWTLTDVFHLTLIKPLDQLPFCRDVGTWSTTPWKMQSADSRWQETLKHTQLDFFATPMISTESRLRVEGVKREERPGCGEHVCWGFTLYLMQITEDLWRNDSQICILRRWFCHHCWKWIGARVSLMSGSSETK